MATKSVATISHRSELERRVNELAALQRKTALESRQHEEEVFLAHERIAALQVKLENCEAKSQSFEALQEYCGDLQQRLNFSDRFTSETSSTTMR